MNVKKLNLLVFCALSLFSIEAIASGFPVGKHKTLLSPYFSYFAAKNYRDLSGNKMSYGNNGRFSSFTAQIYLEHGLTNRLDLVAKIPFSFSRYQDDFVNNTNSAPADVEIGLKYNLLKFNKEQYFFSTQVLASIPAYAKNRNPATGYGQFGSELKFMLSGSEKIGYFNIEGGYRQYFGNRVGKVGQLTYIATSGLHLGKNHQLMGELSGVSSFKSSLFTPENPASNTEFTFVKANLAIGQRVWKENWIFLGVFHDILNKNSGIGQGGTLTGIFRF
ncbi:hypothetical protein [Pedobacter sp. Leaf250]|uniref:hypothetical protein n=1 Tax=Pedobacter sp. Leaf250 TaxID=2876559 RepID=UPI001E537455|nr:hypothetical protein [Pedobacter sp. Leaf250]